MSGLATDKKEILLQGKDIKTNLDLMQYLYAKGSDRVVVFLFARVNKSDIMEFIKENYVDFDMWSKDIVDIILVGFKKERVSDSELVSNDTSVLNLGNYNLSYSQSDFDAYRNEIEKITKWKYSGNLQLMIFNYRFNKIDFSKYMHIDIDKAIRESYCVTYDEVIKSVVDAVKLGATNLDQLSFKLSERFKEDAFGDFIFLNVPFTGRIGRKFKWFSVFK